MQKEINRTEDQLLQDNLNRTLPRAKEATRQQLKTSTKPQVSQDNLSWTTSSTVKTAISWPVTTCLTTTLRLIPSPIGSCIKITSEPLRF